MHPMQDLFATQDSPLGVLRAARLRQPEQVAGGPRYMLRAAFDAADPAVAAMLARLEAAQAAAVSRGEAIFQSYGPGARRRLGAVSALAFARAGGGEMSGAASGVQSVLLRFERRASDGPPAFNRSGAGGRVGGDVVLTGRAIRVRFRPEPIFVASAAAAGLRLTLLSVAIGAEDDAVRDAAQAAAAISERAA